MEEDVVNSPDSGDSRQPENIQTETQSEQSADVVIMEKLDKEEEEEVIDKESTNGKSNPEKQHDENAEKLWILERFGVPRPSVGECNEDVKSKLLHFASLRAKGMSINDSLMRNKTFRNPNILSKLVEFVDVDEKASNMPPSFWDSNNFPQEAYASNIYAKQKKREEDREAAQKSGQRSSISFVSATSKSKSNDDDYHSHHHHHARHGRGADRPHRRRTDGGRYEHYNSHSNDRRRRERSPYPSR